MHWIGPLTQPKIPVRLEYYQNKRIPLAVYEKDTTSVATLRRMREIAEANRWWTGNVNTSVANIEEFFLIGGRLWKFATIPELILDANGLDASTDVDWQFKRYLDGSTPMGDCGTQTTLVDAWAKSMGIATVLHWMYRLGQAADSPSWRSHHYTIYYDSARQVWTAYRMQIVTLGPTGTASESWVIRYFVFRPPVDQKGYVRYRIDWSNNVPDFYYAKLAFYFKEIAFGQTVKMLVQGIPAPQMKQWLLYS